MVIPAWLRERSTREVIVEEDNLVDLRSCLDRNQETEKKKATKMSKTTRDGEGSRIIQIATPRVNKPADEITAKEYDLETIDLGPPTTDQELEVMNDTVKTVHDMLKLEVEKNKKLEKENSMLRSHLQQFRIPLRQHDPSATPPLPPLNIADDFEKMINKTYKRAKAFIIELVKIFDRAMVILERTRALKVAYDTFVYTKDFSIPILQVMKNTSRQTLVSEGVLKDGQ